MSDIEEAEAVEPRRRRFDWGFKPWPNRLFYSVIAGTIANLAVGSRSLGTVVAVVLFVLTSAIAGIGRR